MAPNTDMQIPVTVAGFGLVALGRFILGWLRINYLKQASKGISIDASKEIVLRYAMWNYYLPILCFGLSVMFGVGVLHGLPHSVSVLIYKITSLFFLVGGIFVLYRQLTARVRIFDGKLIYTEGGDRCEILAENVIDVSLNGFVFLVSLDWQKTAGIPSAFASSEIILAFLNQAAKKNLNSKP